LRVVETLIEFLLILLRLPPNALLGTFRSKAGSETVLSAYIVGVEVHVYCRVVVVDDTDVLRFGDLLLSPAFIEIKSHLLRLCAYIWLLVGLGWFEVKDLVRWSVSGARDQLLVSMTLLILDVFHIDFCR
jgi:hypothetical protein